MVSHFIRPVIPFELPFVYGMQLDSKLMVLCIDIHYPASLAEETIFPIGGIVKS